MPATKARAVIAAAKCSNFMRKTLFILITLVTLLLAAKLRAAITFQIVDYSTLTTNSLTNTGTAFTITNANVTSNGVIVITNATVTGQYQAVNTNNNQTLRRFPSYASC